MKSVTILDVQGINYVIIQNENMSAFALKIDKGMSNSPDNAIPLGEIGDIGGLVVQAAIIAKLDPIY